jgi:periplasmic divalent cation tolerance protein
MADLATHVQVLTTLDDRDAAVTLAQAVVGARLVACAQVTGPVTSVYRWQGEVEQATEWYCVMKTTGARYDALAAWIAEHHPYDTPELIATPIVAGADDYLAWITAETASAGGDA